MQKIFMKIPPSGLLSGFIFAGIIVLSFVAAPFDPLLLIADFSLFVFFACAASVVHFLYRIFSLGYSETGRIVLAAKFSLDYLLAFSLIFFIFVGVSDLGLLSGLITREAVGWGTVIFLFPASVLVNLVLGEGVLRLLPGIIRFPFYFLLSSFLYFIPVFLLVVAPTFGIGRLVAWSGRRKHY